MEYIISFMETYGYTAMFIAMVLENANVPIPSEIVLGFAGYLIAQGIFDMHTTMVVGILAGIVGSMVSYWMGEHGGRPLLLKYGKYIFFTWCSYLYLLPCRNGTLSHVAFHHLDGTRYDSLDDFARLLRQGAW